MIMKCAGMAVALISLAAVPASAKPEKCLARVIKDVPAMEDATSILRKGSKDFRQITGVVVNKKTGKMFYCAHGSFCYDSAAIEIVSPCRFFPAEDKEDEAFNFEVD